MDTWINFLVSKLKMFLASEDFHFKYEIKLLNKYSVKELIDKIFVL